MADIAIPSTIRQWMQNQLWGEHHLRWHTERQWDRLSPGTRAQLSSQGWSRKLPQEGTAGNGLDFLMMHRAMLKILRTQFPGDSSWFIGWLTPPTDPDDTFDPVPANSTQPRAFSIAMTQAIQRLTNDLNSFASEDELGLYLETRFRPIPGNPANLSPDSTAGIHNYLHRRFSDSSSDVDMGDPSVNIENARFWKLHGWIDQVWSKYRQLKGLSDTDAQYVSRLEAEVQAMSGSHHHHLMANLRAASAAATSRMSLASLPQEARQPFRESVAMQVQRLLHSNPVIQTRDELIEYLQVAIQIEHATLPLYLTAMWSLKNGGVHADTLLTITQQEMGHLGIVCNLLNAIDSEPHIIPPSATLPIFPGPLPGLDLSDFTEGDIALEPFSTFGVDKKSRIKLFMRIEQPAVPAEGAPGLVAAVPKFHTIGEFYDVIIEGVRSLDARGLLQFPESRQNAQWQLTPFPDMQIIKNAQDALAQLTLIKEQGEGASPSGGGGDASQAHYYLFKQIVDEHTFDWSSGSPQPGNPLPFPNPDDVYGFTPAPVGGHPESAAFDALYSQMLEALHDAWHGDPAVLGSAIGLMYSLTTEATSLMADKQLGPNFLYVPQRAPVAPPSIAASSVAKRMPRALPLLLAAVSTPGYARVREILDTSVNGESFGAHGAFWRSLTRDQFVAKSVFGRPLIATRPDGTFDPDESNLIKALEGRAPFGKNNVPPTPGAFLNRMPDGYPPLAQALIDEIRQWISAGCPEVAPAAVSVIDNVSPASATVDDYVLFWRNFDNVAMFEATPQVQEDIGAFFDVINTWLEFAHDDTKEAAWDAAVSGASVLPGLLRLETLQRQAVTQVFGVPTKLADLLMCWELFGDNTLPADPLRPVDPRHTMNGTIMWFIWAGFADAAIRLSSTNSQIAADFWYAMARSILIGLLNDGVFRGRFPVTGFPATAQGKADIRSWVASLTDNQLSAELRTRLVQGGF